jgi:hypothetical protein
MKTLIVLVLGLLAGGCGQSDIERLEEENRRMEAQLKNDKLKAELEVENKKKSVVGEYERKEEDGTTYKQVYLENGVSEYYFNGKIQGVHRWSIVNREMHVKNSSRVIRIYRINTDKSITMIADILGGERTDYSKVSQSTYKKTK